MDMAQRPVHHRARPMTNRCGAGCCGLHCGDTLKSADAKCALDDEPEIVRLLIAHYRQLLELRLLTEAARNRLTRLAEESEAWLARAGHHRPDGASQLFSNARNQDQGYRSDPDTGEATSHGPVQTACLRLVLVEDDGAVAEALTDVLGVLYHVVHARSLVEAMALIPAHCPHIVLTDCLLPDGPVANVVATAEMLGAAVVLMSGEASFLDPYQRDGYRCLLKPFGTERLLRTIAMSAAFWR